MDKRLKKVVDEAESVALKKEKEIRVEVSGRYSYTELCDLVKRLKDTYGDLIKVRWEPLNDDPEKHT